MTGRWAAHEPGLVAVARRRFAVTGLAEPRFDTVEDVVRWFGAVQAQEYWPAMWGLSQRLRKPATEKEIEAQLDAGAVVRTHVLRPTWHWALITDLPWMLALTGASVRKRDENYGRQVGLTDDLIGAALPVIEQALTGRPLPRRQLREALAEAGIEIGSGQLMGHVMMAAEQEGLVCSGPRAGNQHTYSLLRERLAGTGRSRATGSRRGFLGRLASTFFRGHGPATELDFRWWSGFSAADSREAIEAAGADVRPVEVDGARFWAPGGDAGGDASGDSAPEPRGIQLLQAYDEYTVAFTRSKRAFQLAVGPENVHLYPGFLHTVLDGTQLAGHWQARRTGTGLALAVRLYREPTKRVTAGLQREAERQARFVAAADVSVSVEVL